MMDGKQNGYCKKKHIKLLIINPERVNHNLNSPRIQKSWFSQHDKK